MKPGYASSEFWVTVASTLVTFLAVFLHLTADDTVVVQDSISKTVVPLFTVISNLVVAWKYIHSRTELKALEVPAASSPPSPPSSPSL